MHLKINNVRNQLRSKKKFCNVIPVYTVELSISVNFLGRDLIEQEIIERYRNARERDKLYMIVRTRYSCCNINFHTTFIILLNFMRILSLRPVNGKEL